MRLREVGSREQQEGRKGMNGGNEGWRAVVSLCRTDLFLLHLDFEDI